MALTLPEPPPGVPDFRQENLLDYYVDGEQVLVNLPRYGRLELALAAGRTRGELLPAALSSYGVLEDLLAISLAPHLRRRGMFLVHAFAAAHRGHALLLVGGVGAGKTTTGMALLDAGWQLLSNDSPLLNGRGEVLSYPGVLAAYPDTLRRFATTTGFAANRPAGEKVLLAAEEVWPGVWAERAPIGAICFPQIEPAGHRLESLSAPETLRRLLPHAVEQWDRPAIAPHLAALRALVERAPGYLLHLGPEVAALPALLDDLLPAR